MFTGCAVYEYVKEHYNLKKPHDFVSRGGTSILKSFWEIRETYDNLDNISIDVVEAEILDDIKSELSIDSTNIYIRPFSKEINENDYIDWHINLFEQGKTKVMITGYGNVYNELKKKVTLYLDLNQQYL